jgi:peptidoglycan/LPS O-acetylase OafA/YrhL
VPSSPSSERQAASGFLPEIEGLRALACLAVILSHCLPPSGLFLRILPLGALGVQFFLALSGFLVTRLTLQARDRALARPEHRGQWLRSFYARRALRMLPPYYLLIAVLWLLDYGMLRETVHWHLLCLTNLWRAATGIAFLNHLWVVSVEMQYYLVWPVLLFAIPARLLPGVLPLLIAAGPAYRLTGWAMGFHFAAVNTFPLACLDTFGMGALLALFQHAGMDGIRRRITRYALLYGTLIFIATICLTQLGVLTLATRVYVAVSAAALLYFALLHKASAGITGWPGTLLRSRPLQRIGRVSYGMYLFHPLLWEMLNGIISRWAPGVHPHPWLRAPLLILLSFAAASLSWTLLEAPFARLKSRFPYAR